MRNQTKHRTTQFIMKAFLELLDRKPLSAITVNDICEEAKIHRSTFYRYYEDKFDLFHQVIDFIGNDLYDRAIVRKSNRTFFVELIKYVSDHRSLFLNVAINNQNNDLYLALMLRFRVR
jgi:AcrR family transcriptional regulator